MSRALSQTAAVRRFNRFYTRRIGVLTDDYLGSAFPLPQARVLYELGERGGCTASQLCAELDLDAGYLSRLVAGLRRQGLVAAEAPREDRRRRHLTLTPKGRKAFATLDESSRRAMGEMLAPLAPPHRERLVQAMGAVQAVLESRPKDMTLRAHRPGDIGWVISRHGKVYDDEYNWGLGFEALVGEIGAKFLREFDAKRERAWIAEMDGEPVGSVFVVKQSASVAKLRLLLVEPHARGHGVGRRLVRECIDFSRAAGYRKLVLWTQSNLTAARAIYAALGFRKVRSQPHREFGVPLTGEYWEMKLR
jgi:DNA-binding MarR family transcriptional regulator/N-acetylglutamate synthase-like GNAT family acetyltransferase